MGAMRHVVSLDRTTSRIAAAGCLIAGALAMYWLIVLLRNQLPDAAVHDARINILSLSVLALAFGRVTRRREISDGITFLPMWFAGQSAVLASRFIFNRPHYDFGLPGIMTFAITVGLLGVAIVVRERRRRSAAATQGAVPADEAQLHR
jgi:hypothetical protein